MRDDYTSDYLSRITRNGRGSNTPSWGRRFGMEMKYNNPPARPNWMQLIAAQKKAVRDKYGTPPPKPKTPIDTTGLTKIAPNQFQNLSGQMDADPVYLKQFQVLPDDLTRTYLDGDIVDPTILALLANYQNVTKRQQ